MPTEIVANILLVDDLRENLVALEALIRQEGRRCWTARSGEEALGLMLEHEFALAIIDVQMPSMNGFELASLMRGTGRTRSIPIVFVTAAGRELDYAFRGYETGAVDVLHKPLEPHAVRSKVSVFVDLYRQRVELLRAHAELERAVRMRDDFMSMVSHELRTPLNTLYLQVQLRQKLLSGDSGVDVAALRTMTERDDRQVRSMIRLIDDMLDVSRMRTGRLAITPAATDLAELVRRLGEAFAEQARNASCMLTVETPQHLQARCDGFRIEQVVTNLVTNALRYGQGCPIRIALRQDGGDAVISVRDQGMGIAPEDRERIFGQFERAQSAERIAGLGLGLYITREIVLAHGGAIRVESEPGRGSEFIVRLPLEGPAGETLPAAPA
jgi:signal transduction histidine kinase